MAVRYRRPQTRALSERCVSASAGLATCAAALCLWVSRMCAARNREILAMPWLTAAFPHCSPPQGAMELRPIWVIAIVLTAVTSLLLVPAHAQSVEAPGGLPSQLWEGSRRELHVDKERAKVEAPKTKGPGAAPQPKVQPKLGLTHAAATATTRQAAAKPQKPAAAAGLKPPAANATRPATAKPQKLTAAAVAPRKPAAAGPKPPAAKLSPTKSKPASPKPLRKADPGPPAAKSSTTAAKPASHKAASPQPRASPKPVPKAAAIPAAKAAGKSGQAPAAGRKAPLKKGSKVRRRPIRQAVRAKVASTTSAYGSEITEILDLHNYSRARHGVSPLGWDPTAAVWAENWAKECNWGSNHSDPYISNIAMTYPGWKSVYKTWYDDEVGLYDWAAATYADAWGHFTAIVWKSTTAVGCGKAWCVNMPIGPQSWTGYYYVCNYSPPGNMIGAFRENVLPVLWNAKPKQQ